MNTTIFIDLIVVFSSALVIGTIVRYVIPGRIKHGLMLVPAFSVVFALVVWEISVWAGVPADWAQFAWLVLLVLTSGATVAFAMVVTRRRTRDDESRLSSALQGLRTL